MASAAASPDEDRQGRIRSGSYVCFVSNSKWEYGVVINTTRSHYRVQLSETMATISIANTPVCRLNFPSYVLRPFCGTSSSQVHKNELETSTRRMVNSFLRGEHDTQALYASIPKASAAPSRASAIVCFDAGVGVYWTTFGEAYDIIAKVLSGDVRQLLETSNATASLVGAGPRTIRRRKDETLDNTTSASEVTLEDETFDVGAVADDGALPTANLSAQLKDYGGFPATIFVRKEMKTVWSILLENVAARRFVLVGSPGVGKSALLVLFCCFLAKQHSHTIYLVRSINKTKNNAVRSGMQNDKTGRCLHVMMCFQGAQVSVECANIIELCQALAVKTKDRNVLIVSDGFLQSDMKILGNLSLFQTASLLSTSAQCDPSQIEQPPPRLGAAPPKQLECVAVPAWSEESLKKFKFSTQDEMKEFAIRYAHAGGSLRDFTRPLMELKERTSLSKLSDTAATVLQYDFKPGPRDNLIDTYRRLFVQDTDDPKTYTSSDTFLYVIDSAVVHRNLALHMPVAIVANALKDVENTKNGSLHGQLFERLLHKLAAKKLLRLRIHDGTNHTKWLEVDSGCTFILGKDSTSDCLDEFKTIAHDNAYWCPDYANFPAVDSIVIQGNCVYMLQMTVAKTHKTGEDTVKRIREKFMENSHYNKDLQFHFVVITPPSKSCAYKLKVAGIPTWHGCALKVEGCYFLNSLENN